MTAPTPPRPIKTRLKKTWLGRILDPAKPADSSQPFVSHLVELRDRLLRVVLAIAVVFLSMSPFANEIYGQLAQPMMDSLPQGSTMIATEVAAPFLTPFKFTLVCAFFVSVPFVLYQMWAFVAPGLYANERRFIFPLLISSSVLFYLGMAFAYFAVFPVVFGFLANSAPSGVAVMTDISRYLDFVIVMLFAFGVAFEVPVATVLVIKSGMTTADDLASKRKYVVVGAFVVGMLLTPPDVISQTMLAIPMCLLFELGLWASRTFFAPTDTEA